MQNRCDSGLGNSGRGSGHLEVTMEFLEKHTPIALKKEICKQLLVMI
jgi:hypothetical protein